MMTRKLVWIVLLGVLSFCLIIILIAIIVSPDQKVKEKKDKLVQLGGRHSSFLVDLDHPYEGSKDDLFPNPAPRSDLIIEYKKKLESHGIVFAHVRPVEDIVANFSHYEGKHISLTLPIFVTDDMEPMGSYEGLSFRWTDPRFGTYVLVCPIPQVAKQDWQHGWAWNTLTNTGAYLHLLGVISGLTQGTNRLGGKVQIPTILVYAIDDGWRFAAVSKVTISAQMEKVQRQEQGKSAARERARDLKAAVMMMSEIIKEVEVVQYKDGPGFILSVSAYTSRQIPNRQTLFQDFVLRIKDIAREHGLESPSRIGVWDREEGALAEWNPANGVYILR